MKPSIYQEITQQIIEAMETSRENWFKPWKNIPAQNGITGHQYQGINSLITYLAALERFDSPYWYTFNQVKQHGGTIIKGSKATKIIAYSLIKYDEHGNKLPDDIEDDKVKSTQSFAKAICVFNKCQTEGLPEKGDPQYNLDKDIQTGIDNYLSSENISIFHKGNMAYYNLSKDEIVMPLAASFSSQEGYLATLLHEMAHSTGAKKRLHRVFGKPCSVEYAQEELVAELASAFLMQKLGLDAEIENHASYLKSWIKMLKEDDKSIFRAASAAQKAANYILDSFKVAQNYLAA